MKDKGLKISQLHGEAFVVYDKQFYDWDSQIFEWLKKEGFAYAWHKGNFGCPWAFINITHKIFACGMPGVEITKATGNHAITLDEFMIIYDIYKKYEGLQLMSFKQ